jgi:hypothetical protein
MERGLGRAKRGMSLFRLRFPLGTPAEGAVVNTHVPPG